MGFCGTYWGIWLLLWFFFSFCHDNVICQTGFPPKKDFLFTLHWLLSQTHTVFFFTCMFNSQPESPLYWTQIVILAFFYANVCFHLEDKGLFVRSVHVATQGRPSKKRSIRIETLTLFLVDFCAWSGVTDFFVLKCHCRAGGGCRRRSTGSCVVYFTWHNVCIQSSREASHRSLSAFWVACRQEMK